uniref:FBA_2 domain-containing protein n=1 Tax=Steinernema glaseri TaxID=37863 RepID=A0A1I7ZIF1_9BILA
MDELKEMKLVQNARLRTAGAEVDNLEELDLLDTEAESKASIGPAGQEGSEDEEANPLTTSQRVDDASPARFGMACVPFAFRESVCATLEEYSLWTVRFLFDAPSWSRIAGKVYDQIKHFEMEMKVDGPKEVSCKSSINLEEARKSKYLKCSRLSITSYYADDMDDGMTWNVNFRTLLSLVPVEAIQISWMNSAYIDSYFNQISPCYLRDLGITSCTFNAARPLCTWVKKMLANKCLSSLIITYNSFVEPMDPEDDFQEELYDALVHGEFFTDVAIYMNKFFRNVDISFFKRVLDFWLVSEEGFQGRHRVTLDAYATRFKRMKIIFTILATPFRSSEGAA